MKKKENALVILAGGIGSRFRNKLPKQFTKINGENLIHFFLKRIDTNIFDRIVIVHKNSHLKHITKIKADFPSVKFLFTKSGIYRQSSCFNALKKLNRYKPENILIHDAARPFCSNKMIVKIIKQLENKYSAIPYILNPDKKIISKKEFNNTVKFIQTPQGFKF